MLDSRIGRWFAPDIMEKKFPHYSPYNYCLNNPLILTDPDGKDPIISGISEAATAFALAVGVDFLSAYILEGKSAEQSFKDIGWLGASWDAIKAYGESSIVPGTATASRLQKIANSKVGKVMFAFIEEVGKGTADALSKGKFYNDKGEFDSDNFLKEMKGIIVDSFIQSLIDTGFKGAAEKIMKKYGDSFKNLKKLEQKLENKIANGDSAKRIREYQKKIIKQKEKIEEIKKAYKKVKAVEEIGTAVGGKYVGRKTKDAIGVE